MLAKTELSILKMPNKILCSARHSLDTLQKSDVFTNFCSVIWRCTLWCPIIPSPHEPVFCFLNKSKHLQKICSVCARHHMSMNFTNRNWERYYACSSKGGREIVPTLLIVVRTLTLVRSRHKNPLIHVACDLHPFGS
jgi:hypothetical protein